MVKAMYKYKYPISAPVDAIGVNISIDEKIPDTIAMYRTVSKTIRTKKYLDTEKSMWVVEADDLIDYDAVTELYKEIPRKGLVGEWLFFEGYGDRLHDTSGVNPPNDGTIYGMAWDTLPSGKIIGSFDGVDDYVSIPDSASLDLTTLAIIAWVKTTYSGVGYVRVFSRHADTTNWPLNPYQLAISGTGRPTIIIGDGVNTEKTVDADPINDNKWHMLTGVVTGSELLVYIDGELKQSTPQTITPYDYDGRAAIAKAGSKYFPGSIGLLRIYNIDLSEDEIKSLYELEAPLFGITP